MSWIAGLAAGFACIVVVFVVAELAARRFIRRQNAYYRYRPYMRERHEIDPVSLPQLTPIAHVEINRDGERGGPPPEEGESAWRALIVGGSTAECHYLDQGETWGAVAESVLRQPEHRKKLGVDKVHIGNVSRAILPCAAINILLQKTLPRYRKLDCVIIMVGAADMVSWVERLTPREIPPVKGHLDAIFEDHPEMPTAWRPGALALRRVLSTLNRRLRRPVHVRPDSMGWLRRVRAMRANAIEMIDEVPEATPMVENFGKHFAAMIRTAKAGAARVIVVRQPWYGAQITEEDQAIMWNFGLGRPYKEEVKRYFTPRVAAALLGQVDARAAAVCDELAVQHIDLMPELVRSTRTFYDFMHLSPAGAKQVGELVARAVLAKTNG